MTYLDNSGIFHRPPTPNYAIIHSLVHHLQKHGIPAKNPYPHVHDITSIQIYTQRGWIGYSLSTTEIILSDTTLQITTWTTKPGPATIHHNIDLNDPKSIPELTRYLLNHHQPTLWHQLKQNLKRWFRCS